MSERLNKVLAQHGIGSRREVERWITEGRLELNGKKVKLGDRYEEGDRVLLDGRDVTRRLTIQSAAQVLAYHKPQGQLIERSGVTSEDDIDNVDPGETVMDRLPKQRGVRWVPINPMHAGDSGLLLLTNDGKLSYALTRQKKNIPTIYMVRVHVRGGLTSAPQLSTRMLMDNDVIDFTSVEATGGEGDNVWYKVTMPRADRRAAVRALFASNGLTVSRMMQVAFAGIELTKDLPRSRHQLLKPAQLERLYEAAQLKAERSSINSDEKVRNSAKTDPVKRSDTKVKLKRAVNGTAPGKRRASTSRSRSSRD